MNINKWLKLNTEDLSGKTVAITGATGGLGSQLCKYLVQLNANLILLNRSKKKTENLIQELHNINSNIKIDFIELNLEDMENVKSAVKILKNLKFDYLIHNSGIYNVPRKVTPAGIDNIFQVNFVAPYYITKELLSTMRENKAKVIAVGSIAHNYAKIDEEDIEFNTRKKCNLVYGNSKRFLMFSLYELLKNETDITLSIAHPGVTLTNITNHYPKAINWLVKIGIKILFPSPQKATLHLLSSVYETCDYHTWIGPIIFKVWGKPKKTKLKTCTEQESKKIFEIAENYYKKLKNI